MSALFVPLSQVASYNDVPVRKIKVLLCKKLQKELNELRFKVSEDGQILCSLDYQYPLKAEIERLYFRCLIIAKTEYQLCKDLSAMSGIKPDTLHHYFYRFNFKTAKSTKTILSLLQKYQERSLFKEELDD